MRPIKGYKGPLTLPRCIAVHWSCSEFVGFSDVERQNAQRFKRGVYIGYADDYVTDIYKFYQFEGHQRVFRFYLALADLQYYNDNWKTYSILDVDTEQLLYYHEYPDTR